MSFTPGRSEIKNVVVILAGSRTGSTFLFDQLASTERFYCPQGEETPYYRTAAIGKITSTSDSDAIYTIPDESILDRAAELLLAEAGPPSRFVEDPSKFISTVMHRISFQWPGLRKSALHCSMHDLIRSELERLPENFCDWRKFYLKILSTCEGKKISLEEALLTPLTGASPELPLIEETPFIHPTPRKSLHPDQLEDFPLLLKTSSNVYRTSFLRSLFPNARFRWVILKRNPAATINALIDGWKSGGFHSHYLPEGITLGIKDYSNINLMGEKIWKFDLPPGWENHTQRDLVEVCGFQWLSAYSAIERFLKETKDRVSIATYEDFLGSDSQRHLNEVFRFCLDRDPGHYDFDIFRNSAQVSKPGANKWRKREDRISTCIRKFEDGRIIEAAKKLEYDFDRIDTWI